MVSFDLKKREGLILILLIKRYVDTKKPVPSKYLYNVYSEKLSPSTIRLILFNLEKKGFLKKEHTSSGRIPTDLAYKYFAEIALSQFSFVDMESSLQKNIPDKEDLNELAKSLAQNISEKHHLVTFATAPSLLDARLESFELYPLSDGRVVVFCLSKSGKLFEKAVKTRQNHSYERLRYYSNYITQNYKGWTFREIKNRLNSQILSERKKLTEWVNDALSFISPALAKIPYDVDLFLSGVEWIADIPEITHNTSMLKAFLETIERKEKLLALIDEIMEKGKDNVIVLGSELSHFFNSLPVAIISVSYGDPLSGRGVIGLIGGKAMKYDEALKNLVSSACLLGKASINSAIIRGE